MCFQFTIISLIVVYVKNSIINHEEQAKYSKGIHYVLVNGVIVVKDGSLQDNVFPGKAVRGIIN